MSGFEHYASELAAIDKEILHYAALCGVDVADHAAIHARLQRPHEDWPADKARESLQGLLMLRLKIETEMLAAGLQPPDLGGW